MPSKRKKILLALALTILVMTLIHVFFGVTRSYGVSPELRTLSKHWNFTYKGKEYKDKSSSGFVLPETISRNDSLVLENILPADLPSHWALRLKTFHSALKVYLEDDLIYSKGMGSLDSNRFEGSGFHCVFLPPDAAGKSLRLVMVATEDEAFSSLLDMDLLPAELSSSDYHARHTLPLMIGFFLILFGALSVLISAAVSFFGSNYYRFIMIGLLSFSLGFWTLCYTKLMQVFSFDFAFNTSLEYASLYFAPIPLCLLLLNMRRGKARSWKLWGLGAFAIYGVVFLVASSILHFSDVLHYNQTLILFHIYIVIGFAFLFFSGILWGRRLDLSSKILTAGVVVFAAVGIADLIRYNICRYYALDSAMWDVTWVPLGTLAFVVLLALSYLIYLRKLVADKTERDLLATMVYVDNLTGLYNRAKCQQIFEILDRSNQDFSIVSVDLNGLKVVNDSYGHATGDLLIRAFASAFKTAFFGVGTAIRMGGDEFVAIVRKEHLDDVEKAIATMKRLQEECPEELPVPLESAYGVARRSECNNACSSVVYKAADDKMYAMKQSMKSDLVRK